MLNDCHLKKYRKDNKSELIIAINIKQGFVENEELNIYFIYTRSCSI